MSFQGKLNDKLKKSSCHDVTQRGEEVRHFVTTGHKSYGISVTEGEAGVKTCPSLRDVINECPQRTFFCN